MIRGVRSQVAKKATHAAFELASWFTSPPEETVDLMERDWDFLLVLDACRYDIFKELNTVDGELEKVNSAATSTPQWLRRNFEGEHENVIYVSGNPYTSSIAQEGYFDASEHFFHVEDVWDSGWDEDLRTVPPWSINEALLELKEKHPDKRFIAHYMQPHEPFIGDTKLPEKPLEDFLDRKGMWHHEDIREAYMDNLELVLEHIEELVEELDGKVVVTADHGELFPGEYPFLWNHPKDVFVPELYEVLWLEVGAES